MTVPILNPTATSHGQGRPLVRIVIAGHVDHGKSTLIGRLLHETGSLPDGKLKSLQAISARRGMPFEWSFLLDSLQTERDQGITIDTSQIRFRTTSRDFVLIDAPGHTEFLRNMITGASQADGALLIVDAAEGVRDQTRRHGYMLHLLGVRQLVVVINKMDRVDFDEKRFKDVEKEITTYLLSLDMTPGAIIPISAREGDGVARRTPLLAWYHGPTVLEALDTFSPARPADELPLRLPVQAIYKFDDRRIIAGRIETGHIGVGDQVVLLPSGKGAMVRSIEQWPPDAAAPRKVEHAGRSIGITLDRELFIERGEIITTGAMRPKAARRLRARVFWLRDKALDIGESLNVRIGTAETRGWVTLIDHAIDPGHLTATGAASIAHNQVGEVELALVRPLAADPYAINPRTGRIVLESNGRIVGGGLVLSLDIDEERPSVATNIVPVGSAISPEERTVRHGHHGAIIWLTGLPGAGKSTLGRMLERRLFDRRGAPVLLDGDTLRTGLNSDLGFSAAERAENIRRLAEVAAHLARNGLIAIVAAVSPSTKDREQARKIGGQRFYEVHVSASLEVCESRDPKGHYAKARAGNIKGFTGVGAAYERPEAPDFTVDTQNLDAIAALQELERFLESIGILSPYDAADAADPSI